MLKIQTYSHLMVFFGVLDKVMYNMLIHFSGK
jgi:hypothetical protein